MTETDNDAPEAPEIGLYGDAAAEAASGLGLPSLRVLQAAGAIQSRKMSKYHGGFRRMWPEQDVLRASLAAAFTGHFGWNGRTAAEVLAKAHAATWGALIETSTAGLAGADVAARPLVTAGQRDWHVVLVDRKFLFIEIPIEATTILPDTIFGQTTLLLGLVGREAFTPIPWAFGSDAGIARMQAIFEPAAFKKAGRAYKVAMAAHGNFLSKATINASLQARFCWHQLHGQEARLVQDAVNIETKGDANQ